MEFKEIKADYIIVPFKLSDTFKSIEKALEKIEKPNDKYLLGYCINNIPDGTITFMYCWINNW